MNKLTSIRIKQEDGTYSEEYPVSVLAENVIWEQGQSNSLVDILGQVSFSTNGSIQHQIDVLDNKKFNTSDLNTYLAGQISTDVTSWLNTNVNPVGSAVTVDESLSISGSAADAKITGDNLNNIKSAIDYGVVTPLNWLDLDATADGILKANGTVEASTTYYYTDFIRVKPGDDVRSYSNTNAMYKVHTCAYDINKTVVPSAGSDSSFLSAYRVPSGIYYVRLTFSKTYFSKAMVTINTIPTQYEAYFAPYIVYNRDLLTADTKRKVDGLPTELADENVKGTNVVNENNTGVGTYYYSSGIRHDPTATSYCYAIVNIKPNTRYFVNLACRFWIFTDENDNVLSYGNTGFKRYYFDSGDAKKLYYTVSASFFKYAGLIIAEGYSCTSAQMIKPGFIKGLNQLNDDSWFAVALTPGQIRFTQGISEKLYYFNILALEKNIIDITLGGTAEDDGYLVPASSPTSYNNTYGYTVYDDNLSVVANMPRCGANRLYIYADNVSDCSALLIGDSIIARVSTTAGGAVIGKTLLDAFAERNKTITLLGTLGSGLNKNEGRPGWTAARYFTNDTYEGVVNPFYNPTSQTFDFGYYMTNQGYNSVDFVVIHLGGNDLFSTPLSEARAKIKATEDSICAMIDSILAWNPNQKIIIQLAPSTSINSAYISKVNQKLVRAKFTTFNAEMLVILTKYPTVRVSNDYMIVNPATELADHIHPTNEGLAKIGMELLSQINCWQNGN